MTHTTDNVCRHGVPLVAYVDGPSANCEACTDAFMENPRYYADDLHLPDPPQVYANRLPDDGYFEPSPMTSPREWVVPYQGHDLHLTLAEYRTLRAVGWASTGRADLLAQQFLTREIEAL